MDPHAGDHEGREGKAQVPFIRYSKQGIRDLLDFIRASDAYDWEIPGDVSEVYKLHMDAEELQERHHPRTNEPFFIWIQGRKRNDLFVCECYQAMFMAILGFAGQTPLLERPEDVAIKKKRK